MEKVAQQQPPPASSSEVEFKITTGSMFANGIEIEGLNLNIYGKLSVEDWTISKLRIITNY